MSHTIIAKDAPNSAVIQKDVIEEGFHPCNNPNAAQMPANPDTLNTNFRIATNVTYDGLDQYVDILDGNSNPDGRDLPFTLLGTGAYVGQEAFVKEDDLIYGRRGNDTIKFNVQELSDTIFNETCLDLDNASNASSVQSVSIGDFNGCKKLVLSPASSLNLGVFSPESVYGLNYGPQQKPETPNNPNTFYNLQDLSADVAANTIDENKLTLNEIFRCNFNLTSGATVKFDIRHGVIAELALKSSVFVIRENGSFILGGNGFVPTTQAFGATVPSYRSDSLQRVYSAGNNEVKFYITALNSGTPPALINVVIGATSASNSGQVIVSKAIT